MKLFLNCCLQILFLVACKNHAPTKIIEQSEGQSTPNSCKIEATVIKVLDPSSPDRNDICHRYSCEAIVHIDKIILCGSTITITPDDQDQITVHFAYTLNPTNRLYPTLKPSYPGLQNGSHFSANVEQRLALGDQVNYIVYSYEVK